MKSKAIGLSIVTLALATSLQAKTPEVTASEKVMARVVKTSLDVESKRVEVTLVESKGGCPIVPIQPPHVIHPPTSEQGGPVPIDEDLRGMKTYKVSLDVNDAFDSALHQSLSSAKRVALSLDEDGQIKSVTVLGGGGCGCQGGCHGGCHGGNCGVGYAPGHPGHGGCTGGNCQGGVYPGTIAGPPVDSRS